MNRKLLRNYKLNDHSVELSVSNSGDFVVSIYLGDELLTAQYYQYVNVAESTYDHARETIEHFYFGDIPS